MATDSSLISVFAQTNQTSNSATTSNSTKMNANTTGVTVSIKSLMNTFSASGDIDSLIYVTQRPINTTINPTSLSARTKFILSGDWNLTVSKGKVTNFAGAKVYQSTKQWCKVASHDIINFKIANGTFTNVELSPNKNFLNLRNRRYQIEQHKCLEECKNKYPYI